MHRKLDLTNNKIGRLLVIKKAGVNIAASGYKMPLWLCECECGNKKIIRQQKLRDKSTLSCGCLRKEQSAERMKTLNLITDYKQYIKENSKINNYTNCWEWTGSYFKKGRPRTGIKKCGQVYAARLAYQEFIGIFDQSLLICHECDNPKCVNPDHLFLGTAQDNANDMINKGRSLKGEKHHKAKLTELDVLFIRKSRLSKKCLVRKFNVSICTIRDVKKRRSWDHI